MKCRPPTLHSGWSASDLNNATTKGKTQRQRARQDGRAEPDHVVVGAQHNACTRYRIRWRAVLCAMFHTIASPSAPHLHDTRIRTTHTATHRHHTVNTSLPQKKEYKVADLLSPFCVLGPCYHCRKHSCVKNCIFLGIVVWRWEAQIKNVHVCFWAAFDEKCSTLKKKRNKTTDFYTFHIDTQHRHVTPIDAPQPH